MRKTAAIVIGALVLIGAPATGALAKQRGAASEFGPLVLRNLDGEKVSLASLHGKVVLLNFWATWCQPCIQEMPVLSDLAERYGSRGFVVVAASVDDTSSRSDVARVAAVLPHAMKVWIGATMEDMERLQLGMSVPVSVLLDRDGDVAARHRGSLPHGEIDDKIEELLGGGRPDEPGEPGQPDDDDKKPFDAIQAKAALPDGTREEARNLVAAIPCAPAQAPGRSL